MVLHKIVDTDPVYIHILVDYTDGVIDKIISVSAYDSTTDAEIDITDFLSGYFNLDSYIENINWDEIKRETILYNQISQNES